MPISVQPLVLNYSFAANRTQAQDQVDLAQLDSILAQMNDRITALIDVLNTTQRDDNALSDQAIDFRCLNDDVVANISSQVNTAVGAE